MISPPLETRALTKRFSSSGAPGLDAITLGVPAGRIAGLIGREGSGKTTLLHHWVGLLLPTSGACVTLGRPAAELEAAELQRIGFMPQTPGFLDWMTVRQHLGLLARFYDRWDTRRETFLLRALELDATRKISLLTPGDRRKLASVSAVCHHPKLLILDEPSGASDPIAGERVLPLIVEQAREDGATIVVSSPRLHDMEKIVDWVICLDHGRLAANQALEELRESYAEWIVTASGTPLPPHFSEPYVISREGDARRTRLRVRSGGETSAEFGRRHGATVECRALSLEQIFPLLVDAMGVGQFSDGQKGGAAHFLPAPSHEPSPRGKLGGEKWLWIQSMASEMPRSIARSVILASAMMGPAMLAAGAWSTGHNVIAGWIGRWHASDGFGFSDDSFRAAAVAGGLWIMYGCVPSFSLGPRRDFLYPLSRRQRADLALRVLALYNATFCAVLLIINAVVTLILQGAFRISQPWPVPPLFAISIVFVGAFLPFLQCVFGLKAEFFGRLRPGVGLLLAWRPMAAAIAACATFPLVLMPLIHRGISPGGLTAIGLGLACAGHVMLGLVLRHRYLHSDLVTAGAK